MQAARSDDARSLFLFCEEIIQSAADMFNLGCDRALLGDLDDAFRLVERAIDAGFNRAPDLLDDPDLVSMHVDPRWTALVTKLVHEEPGQSTDEST